MSARLLRSPALHFLALGAVMFAARALLAPAAVVARIPLAPDEIARLGSADAVDEEILSREALAIGLDRRDAAVRERLRRLGAFVGEDARDEATLEAEARRLGLERSDVVVRRHLAAMLRLAVGRLGPADVPDEAELQSYLEQHRDEFTEPARVRLTHVYLARDRHGATLESDARRLLDRLVRDAVAPSEAPPLGDAFLPGAEIGPASAAELERRFGPEFARAVADTTVARWVGPVRSSYGLHLVWVRERMPAKMPSLDAVRSRVLHRMLDERSSERARERLDVIRAQYAPTPVN